MNTTIGIDFEPTIIFISTFTTTIISTNYTIFTILFTIYNKPSNNGTFPIQEICQYQLCHCSYRGLLMRYCSSARLGWLGQLDVVSIPSTRSMTVMLEKEVSRFRYLFSKPTATLLVEQSDITVTQPLHVLCTSTKHIMDTSLQREWILA